MLESETALIVDDSESARRTIRDLLRDYLNCRSIVEATDGAQAARLLQDRAEEITWVFCELEMNGFKGDEFITEVRKLPPTADAPFILISGKADRDALLRARQAGVDAFLVKPFDGATLLEKVRGILKRTERRSSPRVRATSAIRAIIELGGSNRCIGQLQNLSREGCLIQADHGFSRGVSLFDRVALRIALPADLQVEGAGEDLQVRAEVIRIESTDSGATDRRNVNIGFRFTDVDAQRSEQIRVLHDALRAQTTVPPDDGGT